LGNFPGTISSYRTTPVDTRTILISELMYFPSVEEYTCGLTVCGADSYQFIEFMNFGTAPVNLCGLSVLGGKNSTGRGIGYAFDPFDPNVVIPPGGFLVLANNQALLKANVTNPNITFFQGGFGNSGALGHGGGYGDKLDVVDWARHSSIHFKINWTNSFPWPKLAAGYGYSLVPYKTSDRDWYMSDGQNWRASEEIGGSPGAADAATGAGCAMTAMTFAALCYF